MYYYFNGTLVLNDGTSAVIDCGGVGYKCSISQITSRKLGALGSAAKLFTHLHVREDAMELFGFYDMEELNCFKMLTSVSGVGPKAALAILSVLTPESFAMAVVTGNVKLLTKAQGVGAKLAQRIALELKDKMKSTAAQSAAEESDLEIAVMPAGDRAEAVNALMVLGYKRPEAAAAVNKVVDGLGLEDIIKQALKNLM